MADGKFAGSVVIEVAVAPLAQDVERLRTAIDLQEKHLLGDSTVGFGFADAGEAVWLDRYPLAAWLTRPELMECRPRCEFGNTKCLSLVDRLDQRRLHIHNLQFMPERQVAHTGSFFEAGQCNFWVVGKVAVVSEEFESLSGEG